MLFRCAFVNNRKNVSAPPALPGFRPNAEILSVNIDPGALRKLTPDQLKALDKATAGKKGAISQAIQNAVAAEEQRCAEEEKKREEEERKKKCQQGGTQSCPQQP